MPRSLLTQSRSISGEVLGIDDLDRVVVDLGESGVVVGDLEDLGHVPVELGLHVPAALEGPDHVVGGELVAGEALDTLAELEGDRLPVGRRPPSSRPARPRSCRSPRASRRRRRSCWRSAAGARRCCAAPRAQPRSAGIPGRWISACAARRPPAWSWHSEPWPGRPGPWRAGRREGLYGAARAFLWASFLAAPAASYMPEPCPGQTTPVMLTPTRPAARAMWARM